MAKLSKKIDRLNKKLYKANKKQAKYDEKHPIQTAGKTIAVGTVCAAADIVIINALVNRKIKKAASTAVAANGTPAPEKKKGFFKRHFGKKDKDAPAAATPATPAAPAEGATTA